jgi:hypothetical protein
VCAYASTWCGSLTRLNHVISVVEMGWAGVQVKKKTKNLKNKNKADMAIGTQTIEFRVPLGIWDTGTCKVALHQHYESTSV